MISLIDDLPTPHVTSLCSERAFFVCAPDICVCVCVCVCASTCYVYVYVYVCVLCACACAQVCVCVRACVCVDILPDIPRGVGALEGCLVIYVFLCVFIYVFL
jgi:hypothetical protein